MMNKKIKQLIHYIRQEQAKQQEKCEALSRILSDLQKICPHDEVEVTHTYRYERRECKVCGHVDIIR